MGLRLTSRICLMCALALTTVFVSCSDEFDDSKINNRLDTLEERVAKLETEITTQISSLTALINGKTTVSSWTLDAETQTYKIILSDGSTLSVAQAETSTMPKISVAQDADGAYYWTLDGEPMLNASGENLYVDPKTAPSLRVNPGTGEWEISADGGATYLSTGIKAGDNASLITKVDDDATYVYFTLSDGTKLRVSKTVDFRIAMLCSKQYFAAAQTKAVKLDLSGVKKMAVYSKPEGWKASIVNEELSIKAPAANNASAELKGSIIVQAWFNDGTSDISEVAVEVGEAPHEITVNMDMSIAISTSDAVLNKDNWYGMAYGVTKYSDFSEKWLMSYIETNSRLNWDKNSPYTTSLKQLLGSDPVKGESYVVWGIDKFGSVGSVEYGEIIYTVVVVPDLAFAATEITFEDAMLSVTPKGIAKYYGGVFDKSQNDLDYYLDGINNYNEGVLVNGAYSGPLSKYAPLYGGTNKLQTGKTYCIYAIPYVAGKKDYTAEDAYTYEITIKEVTLGGTAVVTVGDIKASSTSVEATVTRGAGVYKYYTEYVADKDMAEYDTDEKLLAFLLKKTGQSTETYVVSKSGLLPDTKGWIVAVGIDKESKAGTIIKKEAATTELTYSDLTISKPETTVALRDATVKFPATAGIVQYKYIDVTLSAWNNSFIWGSKGPDGKQQGNEELTEKCLAIESTPSYNYKFVDAQPDGSVTLTLTGKTTSTDYVLFAMGVDADGNSTRMVRVDYTPQLAASVFVPATDPRYATATVTDIVVAGKAIGEYLQSEFDALPRSVITFNITRPANCQKCWYLINEPEGLQGVTKRHKTGSMISNYSTKEVTEETMAVSYPYYSNTSHIYVAWQDMDGNYYEYLDVSLRDLAKEDPKKEDPKPVE